MSEEITRRIASQLPPYYPIAEGTGNYKLMEPAAIMSEVQREDIREIEFLTNASNPMAPELVVEAGETRTIEDGEILYRSVVTVYGTLIVEGTLYATDVDTFGAGEITVDQDGGVIEIANDIAEFISRLENIAIMVGVFPEEGETYEEYHFRVMAEFAIMTCEGTPDDILDAAASVLGMSKQNITIGRRIGPGEVSLTFPASVLDDVVLSDSELSDILERLVSASYSLSTLQRGTFTYINKSTYAVDDHDATKGYDGLDVNDNPKGNGGTYAGELS